MRTINEIETDFKNHLNDLELLLESENNQKEDYKDAVVKLLRRLTDIYKEAFDLPKETNGRAKFLYASAKTMGYTTELIHARDVDFNWKEV